MKIDSKAIRELADLLEETGLTEIEVSEGDKVIRVGKVGMSYIPAHTPANMPSDPTVPQKPSLEGPQTIAKAHPGAVSSPMVGTAYLQPQPNSPSFVKRGDNVKAGDTLLIIEAMKVMNPIKAEKAGTVVQILIENGQPVEFGEVLMVIE
jgi:acetyl-CoA carboxylase biotin carboxyl carrier protein